MKYLFALFAVTLFVPSVGYGTLVTYTDRPSWEAALSGAATLEDFEGASSDVDFGASSATSPNGDLGLSGNANFNSNAIIDVSPYRSPGSLAFINGNVVLSMRFLDNGSGANPQETVTVTLPSGLSAFAFEFKNSDSDGDGTFLSFAGTNGGTVGAFNSTVNGFFGIVDTAVGATISSFAFTADPSVGTSVSAFNSFDDVRYGIAAVPEPTGFALFGLISGLAACVVGIRRLSHASPDRQSA